MGYDGTGTLRWMKRSDGQLTLFVVDGLGRTVQTIANVVSGGTSVDQNLTTTTTLDAAGRQIATTDAAGRVTQFGYDGQDRLVTVTENVLATCAAERTDCNVVTRYGYDRVGNRLAITDAKNQTRRFTYNAANEQTSSIDALGRTTGWLYDVGGRVTRQDDPRGDPFDITFGYDGLDRQTQITPVNTANLRTISTTYDALGRRLTLGDATGTTTFTPDAFGRTTRVNAPTTGVVNYTYTARSERASITYPSGRTFSYQYQPDSRLDTVREGLALLADYDYDAVGRLATVQRANTVGTSYAYDAVDRLNGITTGTAQFGYSYDRAGLRAGQTETVSGTARTIAYAYDGLYRLTGADASSGNDYTYGYDRAGNRTDVWTMVR